MNATLLVSIPVSILTQLSARSGIEIGGLARIIAARIIAEATMLDGDYDYHVSIASGGDLVLHADGLQDEHRAVGDELQWVRHLKSEIWNRAALIVDIIELATTSDLRDELEAIEMTDGPKLS